MSEKGMTMLGWCKALHRKLSAVSAQSADAGALENLLREYLVITGAVRTAIDEILSSLPEKIRTTARRKDRRMEKNHLDVVCALSLEEGRPLENMLQECEAATLRLKTVLSKKDMQEKFGTMRLTKKQLQTLAFKILAEEGTYMSPLTKKAL